MKSDYILKQLSKYLPANDIERLRMNLVLEGSIVMCLAIADITKHYRCSQEDEKQISELLSSLCRIHFKKLKPKRLSIHDKPRLTT